MRKSERVHFSNGRGEKLCGIVESTDEVPTTTAVFSHCFTCTKDLKSTVRISRALAQHGIEVLRFDFTGLGDSQGSFTETNFSTNRQDVLAALQFMRERGRPAELLIGHSLGGAAMMSVANEVPEAKLLVTLASPSDTQHLAELLSRMNRDILTVGEGNVTIGGQEYLIKQQMIDDLNAFDLPTRIARWQKPHLIFHSPVDQTLGLKHARLLLETSGGNASLISLKDADHLFTSDSRDVPFIADSIALWAQRYGV